MRLIIDSLVAIMLAGILAGMALHHRNERKMEERAELAISEIHRFHSQIMLQAALEKVELTQFGYPTTVDAAWFSGNLPVNPLLAGGHPWVEVAGESVRELTHPVRRMATGTNVAQFWYNPYKGVLRARVPADVSEATGLDLYNRVNDCDLEKLYGRVE